MAWEVGAYRIPPELEVTFVRKGLAKSVPCHMSPFSDLDLPDCPAFGPESFVLPRTTVDGSEEKTPPMSDVFAEMIGRFKICGECSTYLFRVSDPPLADGGYLMCKD